MKKFLFVAMAAAAMVACTPKQSAMDLDEVTTDGNYATVKVNAYYNPGEHEVNGTTINEEKVATGLKMVAKVAYADYSYSTAAPAGDLKIAGVDNGDGSYTFQIPCGDKSVNVAEIKVEPKQYERWSTTTKMDTAYYTVTANTLALPLSVSKGQVELGKITMGVDGAILPTDYSMNEKTFVIKGKVTKVTETIDYKDADADPKDKASNVNGIELKYVKAADVTLEVTVESTADTEKKLVYTTTTNEDGEFNYDVKYYSTWDLDDIQVTVEAKSFVPENNFVHRVFKYNTEESAYFTATQSVYGFYKKAATAPQKSAADAELIGINYGEIQMTFEAEDKASIFGDAALGLKDGGNAGDTSNKLYKSIGGGLWD